MKTDKNIDASTLRQCLFCNKRMDLALLRSHVSEAHVKGVKERVPPGRILPYLVLLGFSVRLLGHAERCEDCRQKIAYLDIGNDAMKAFDISPDNIIVGAHICNGRRRRSGNAAVSGGAFDSNRRRH